MIVCVDTNVLVRLFTPTSPFAAIPRALLRGKIALALSNEISLEWEEITTRESGAGYLQEIVRFLDTADQLNHNVILIAPTFRFHVIAADPDDNKFVDCAIGAESDFLLTDDHHFSALIGSGYKPRPITPDEFIAQHLS